MLSSPCLSKCRVVIARMYFLSTWSLPKTSTTTSETKPAQFFGRPDSFLSGKYCVLIIAIMGIKLYTEYPVQASSRAAETFEEQFGSQ
jgi:hypothetical protein